jgi:hypothetical protein
MPSKKARANSPRTLKRRANALAALAQNGTRNAPKVSKANYKKEAEERALAAKAVEEASIALELAKNAAIVAAHAVKTAEEAAKKIEAAQKEAHVKRLLHLISGQVATTESIQEAEGILKSLSDDGAIEDDEKRVLSEKIERAKEAKKHAAVMKRAANNYARSFHGAAGLLQHAKVTHSGM